MKTISVLTVFFTILAPYAMGETIVFNDGRTIEARLLKNDPDKILVDFHGVELTYYKDEISSIRPGASGAGEEPVTVEKEAPPQDEAFGRGMEFLEKGSLWEAIGSFKKSIKNDPGDYHPYYNIAGTYFIMGKFAEAVDWYLKTLKIDPGNFNAYIGMGMAYRLQLKFDAAIAALNKAVEINPESALAMAELAKAYQGIDNYTLAAKWYSRSLEIDPANPENYNFLGMACGRLGDYDNAIKAFTRAVTLDPGYADAYLSLGATLVARQERTTKETGARPDFSQAIEYLNKARALYSKAGDDSSNARIDAVLKKIKELSL